MVTCDLCVAMRSFILWTTSEAIKRVASAEKRRRILWGSSCGEEGDGGTSPSALASSIAAAAISCSDFSRAISSATDGAQCSISW